MTAEQIVAGLDGLADAIRGSAIQLEPHREAHFLVSVAHDLMPSWAEQLQVFADETRAILSQQQETKP